MCTTPKQFLNMIPTQALVKYIIHQIFTQPLKGLLNVFLSIAQHFIYWCEIKEIYETYVSIAPQKSLELDWWYQKGKCSRHFQKFLWPHYCLFARDDEWRIKMCSLLGHPVCSMLWYPLAMNKIGKESAQDQR